ncbi:DUF732 domain-containing protein [Mycolicibacter icosiumassiliensis]|uniref:DUF732 domain-containing protein n=1 Tax=Mycolicibacter icosiumassiliensis TaxID=1792835 RepID=UPI00082EA0A2|nr:DUF732 domain-containing protein [Mycolicibacter icosiumassiliensis]
MRLAGFATIVATAITLAAPAHADIDTEFADQLHSHGIYGSRDHNAWLAEITCERLLRGVDATTADSTRFLSTNLALNTSQPQAGAFLATALAFYCPDRALMLDSPTPRGVVKQG